MEDLTNRPSPEACPVCGILIPENAPGGLCPKCLLSGGTRAADGGPEAPEREEIQRRFPELELGRPLGRGGMGMVFQALQPRLRRQVALKVLSCPPELRDNFAVRFEREARTLALLNHPNIVTIHDSGERDGLFYFVMELVDGPDLGRLIATGDLQPAEALRIVPQICEALQYAHDKGITHRDIKPANILIDRSGVVKIADFGLAKLAGDESDPLSSGLTYTGASMGTPLYMAPEQWETPWKVDHRADIYSLGVVFYEMLTGEKPAGVFKPPSEKSPVDRRLDRIVMQAMEKEPEHRYQQASEVKDDVTQVIEHPAPPVKTRPAAAWWSVVCLAALGIGGWLFANRDAPEKTPATAFPAHAARIETPAAGRIVTLPLRPNARFISPGAPWDVSRDDIVDLKRGQSGIGIGGFSGPDQGVTLALTSGGTLLSWVNRIPGASVVPEELRDAKFACFELERPLDARAPVAAVLESGETVIWSYWIDVESQRVRVTSPREISFSHPGTPVQVRPMDIAGGQVYVALFPDGNLDIWPVPVPLHPSGAPHIDIDFLRSLRGVKRIVHEHAMMEDGKLVFLPARTMDLISNSPAPAVEAARFDTHWPIYAAIEPGGSLHCWFETGSLWGESHNLIEAAKLAGKRAPLSDLTMCATGGLRFAIRNEAGDWHVSHGDLTRMQRKALRGARMVYRDAAYVVALMDGAVEEVRPARSRGRLCSAGGGLDLKQAAWCDDFIDVSAGPGSWAALRSNGEVVTWNGEHERSGVEALVHGTRGGFAFITREGRLVIPGSADPQPLDGTEITGASMGEDHGIALTSGGDAVLWGARYQGADAWAGPPAEWLRAPRAIAAGEHHAAVVTTDGSLGLWGRGGVVEIETVPGAEELGDLIDIAGSEDDFLLLSSLGDVWQIVLPRNPESGGCRIRRVTSGRALAISPRCWADDWNWHVCSGAEESGGPLKQPPVPVSSKLIAVLPDPDGGREAALLWIQGD